MYQNSEEMVIDDGYPTHRSKKVMVWLSENKKKIMVSFLPPYSPELNPDQYLNQDVKINAIRKKFVSSQDDILTIPRNNYL